MTETNKPNISSKQDIADDIQSQAQDASRQIKDKGREQLDEYGSQAAGSMESVAEAAQAAAESLDESQQTMLSSYVSELASGISDLAGSLRDKNTDEILQDVGRLARENAGLFLLGSVAIGFGLARIAKAGEDHGSREQRRGWEGYYGVSASGYETDEEQTQQSSGRQSSFSETDADAREPRTHADTSYLPDEGSGASTSQQSRAGGSLTESPNSPSGGNAQRPV